MTEIVEQFTDGERVLMLRLIMDAHVQNPDVRLIPIIRRLSGSDTVIVAHRAYPSQNGNGGRDES